MFVAVLKGLAAGACTTAPAWLDASPWPALPALGASQLVGSPGHGPSLSMFAVALRQLDTTRTGAYFSGALLFGVALSPGLWPGVPGASFWVAAAPMALGV